MATTVNAAIALIQRAFPDCDSTTATDYLNEADRIICAEIPIRVSTESVVLTTSSNEVAISTENVLRVWAARYRTNSTSSHRLTETDITALDLLSGDWRSVSRQVPRRFYLSNNSSGALVMGFHPAPVTATTPADSTGFPIVLAYVTLGTTLAGGGSLPATLQSSDPYVFCACWRYAMDKARDEEGFWYQKYLDAMSRERNFQFARSAYDEPGFIFPYMPNGGVV